MVSWLPLMFLGYKSIYIGERSTSVELREAHEGGGHAYHPVCTNLPRGRLTEFQTSTPSLLVCFRSKKDHREGFIPFDIPFLQNTKIGKKTETGTGPPVNRLAPKII